MFNLLNNKINEDKDYNYISQSMKSNLTNEINDNTFN